ncbi:alpha-keto acid decarboxylase family protein [Streptomyces monticola]|uniref:Alpha-keto-acid decarboxylase n=1 Tax=Streptomyces monticola TaxID=2666263 RepID=A0ABW2JQF2_9ACTN
MPDHIPVATYLALRLQQLGVDHLFGLPGDYNLGLLDALLADSTLQWVGAANELNAGYAADGYARVRGLGVVVTTYGVGELSAINAIAGSFAESVPVLQLTGSPDSAVARRGAMVHHTLADGDFQHFLRAYQEVTASAEILTPSAAHTQIDRALTTALDNLQPVYLSVPTDLVHTLVPSSPLRLPLPRRHSDQQSLAAFGRDLRARLAADDDEVTLLAGNLLERRGLQPTVRRIADTGRVTVAALTAGKGILDENHPAAAGTYCGVMTPSEHTRQAVEKSPHLIVAGAVLSDMVTGLFSHSIGSDQAVFLDLHRARLGGTTYEGIELDDAMSALADAVDERRESPRPVSSTTQRPRPRHASDDDDRPLTQDALWSAVQDWIAPDTYVLADVGTAFYGAAALALPPGCSLQGQPTWSSIGYTLPALLGSQLAQPERPALLIIGDGAAQLTVQELGTILHRRLTPVILLLNNAGYTVERAIREPDSDYHDIVPWQWTSLPAALGGQEHALTLTVRTPDELRSALRQARTEGQEQGRASLIEVHLDRFDTPPLLTSLTRDLDTARRGPT